MVTLSLNILHRGNYVEATTSYLWLIGWWEDVEKYLRCLTEQDQAFVNDTEATIGSSVRHSKPFQTMVHMDIGSVMFKHYNSSTSILEFLKSIL